MSEILNEININDYNVQKMQGNGGGGGTEDLSVVLAAQDTALSTQETKIAQAIQALADKKSIDLAEETSDATATANDIKQGKTAYVNGVKVEGIAEISDNNAKIDTSKTYKYSKGIVSIITEIGENFDTSEMVRTQNLFSGCSNLIKIPVLSFAGIMNDDYAISYMFSGCSNLSNESLNNILKTCTTISSNYHGNKTLKTLDLTSAQATTCQTLSNWDAFVEAGWSSGY